MKIVVVGAGYVGLISTVAFAEMGYNIICLDKNKEKINLLKKYRAPFYEKELQKYINKNKNRLIFTNNEETAYKNADFIFICVGTPEREDGSTNLDYIYASCDDIIKYINKSCILVVKSTVPIGTCDKIEKYINDKIKHKVRVVSNPEFLAQGSAMNDMLYSSRIVIGTKDLYSKRKMEKFYKPFLQIPYNTPCVFMDRRSSEMVKYASNCFLALKISYINEIANLCEKFDADIDDVVKGMSYDERIGNKFLKPGIGFGGSCFPKDTKSLHYESISNDLLLETIKSTISVNENQTYLLSNKLYKIYNNLENLTVGILGLTFKPGTDDLRHSPAIKNINKLLQVDNIKIKCYDPMLKNLNLEVGNSDKIECFNTIDEAIKDTDVVLIFTEWKDIVKYNLSKYETLMKKPVILDGRNCYNLKKIKKHKIYYNSVGRTTINNIDI